MRSSRPTISIVIPTYNEERRLAYCLDSIFMQDYPEKFLEVIIIDNYSDDKTIDIARRYPVVIIKNKIRDTQISKKIGLDHARGDLVYHVDADMEMKSKDYLTKLVYPLIHNDSIVGSFGSIAQSADDSPLNRFLTYDIHQRDPVLEFFSPSVSSTIIEEKKGYVLCKYTQMCMPPEGRCLYWRKKLKQTTIMEEADFRDLDSLATLVNHGFCYFAYVPGAEAYHRHVQDFPSLILKRLRNIHRNFLPHYETRTYTWFQFHSREGIIKIGIWLIYAHLFIPALIRGCVKGIRHKDIACVWYEPMLALVLTDITLFGFFSNMRGIRFIWHKILH